MCMCVCVCARVRARARACACDFARFLRTRSACGVLGHGRVSILPSRKSVVSGASMWMQRSKAAARGQERCSRAAAVLGRRSSQRSPSRTPRSTALSGFSDASFMFSRCSSVLSTGTRERAREWRARGEGAATGAARRPQKQGVLASSTLPCGTSPGP